MLKRLIGLMLASLSLPANAAVTYTFTALSGGYSQHGEFQFTLPNPIPTVNYYKGFVVPVQDLAYCSAGSNGYGTIAAKAYGCTFQSFRNDVTEFTTTGKPYDVVLFGVDFYGDGNGGASAYYFQPNAFETPGFYHSVVLGADQAGTLKVEFTAPAVPEPATWVSLLCAFFTLGWLQRRKTASTLVVRPAR